jgi:hypothetical protein
MSIIQNYNVEEQLTAAENRAIEKREADEIINNAMKEFLASGGKIQQIERGVSQQADGASYAAWGAARKAGRPTTDTTASIADLNK